MSLKSNVEKQGYRLINEIFEDTQVEISTKDKENNYNLSDQQQEAILILERIKRIQRQLQSLLFQN